MVRYRSCRKRQKTTTRSTLRTEQWNNLERFKRNMNISSWHSSKNSFERSDLKTVKHSESCERKPEETGRRNLFREFDPGSGWTLAACLTHASRTKRCNRNSSEGKMQWLSGGRVSNAWATCLTQGDNSWKRLLIPHMRTGPHGLVRKTPVV